MKRIFTLFTVLFALTSVYSEGVHSKAYTKRVELIGYLRALEPMVKNFPGKDKDGNEVTIKIKTDKEGHAYLDGHKYVNGHRYVRYQEIKRVFQEGLLFFFEGSYVNAYRRFLEAQLTTEQLMEELSQEYVDRTEDMLKASVDKKDENEPTDKSLIDITIESGPQAKIRRVQTEDRESPKVSRRHDPKQYHYVLNKRAIEENIATGYKYLSEARDSRINALKIERSLEKHQKLEPDHRKYRIEHYFATIYKCRDARQSAVNVFRLKYPNDNYGHLRKNNPEAELEGVKMNYNDNPYVNRKNLSPVFDKAIPQQFRRHASDINGLVYDEVINEKVKLKYDEVARKEMKVPEDANSDDAPGKTGDSPTPVNPR